ncbi:MAG: MerC domain-containing protein [Erythrobacter sp.]|nr:MerC domain-containing protein [Erythrobacter sp.]
MQTAGNYDRAAATLSVACIAHCLALPLLASVLPFVAAVAEAEWVHWLLSALAIAASATVIARAEGGRTTGFMVPGLIGIVFLVGALFAEPLGAEETLPTVIGGALLAAAHIRRLFSTA